jgi:putative ABC transport system permease protein
VWLAPDGLPRLEDIAINGWVLLFTLAISLLAGLLFGLVPVLRFGEPSVTALKEGGRSASDGPTRHRARSALVVAEIALALVLLVVSGLMARTFVAHPSRYRRSAFRFRARLWPIRITRCGPSSRSRRN